jgi:hypothetical protein
MAVPRIGQHDQQADSLPEPLTPGEAAQIRQILTLQAAGAFHEAAEATDRLETRWMLGPLLADRYLNPAYRPTVRELTAWLATYGDEPDASAIRMMLHRLTPERAATAEANASSGPLRPAVGARVRALFVQNRDTAAVSAAAALLHRPGRATVMDGLFAAGLAAWRLDQPSAAGDFFAAAYGSAETAPSRAAAAFWIARTRQKEQNAAEQADWLRRAAREPDAFYGYLARRILVPSPACLNGGTLGEADTDLLLATPQGRRGFAFLQVGDRQRAAAELRTLWMETRPDPDYGRAVMLVARAVGLNALGMDMPSNGWTPDQVPGRQLPPRLRPNGGFVVDPPLVYALVRRESNFRTGAVSEAGARGLMQIMPDTAAGIGALPAAQVDRLHDPAVNLAIGQRYLLLLAQDDAIRGNLLRLLAAYTQGPGAVRHWADSVNDRGDPLMFIEAIPNRAIADYIRSALLTAWHYAAAMHMPAGSLDALAASTYPRLERAKARGVPAEPDFAACWGEKAER